MILGAFKTLFAFVLVLAPLVFIHELGHFLAAKLFRIGVPVFSLGFGPRLFGFRKAETDYRVSLIPLGGYVRMTGDEADEHRTGAPEEFLSRPKWQRFIVFVAGAAFNIVLAFVAFWIFFGLYGKPEIPEMYPLVFSLEETSTARDSGFEVGDRIIAIDGEDIKSPERFSDLSLHKILLSPSTRVPITVERGDRRLTLPLDTGSDPKEGAGNPGWVLGYSAIIEGVTEGGPADKAGLLSGDIILRANDREPVDIPELSAVLHGSPGGEVALRVLRGDETLEIGVVPRFDEERQGGMIDIRFELRRSLTWGEAAAESYRTNVMLSKTVFLFLRKLISAEIPVRTMSSPIGIAQYARDALEIGPQALLNMLGFFSLQLGILNLLPIPILDGGHILVLLIESVMRRDLSQRLKERFMQAGLVFLLTFMAVVVYFDLWKKFQ